MMSTALDFGAKIQELIPRLSPDQQRLILDHVQELVGTSRSSGVSGRELVKLFGIMSKDAAEEMKQIIEEDCERIDPESW